jgi:hypothetical protein
MFAAAPAAPAVEPVPVPLHVYGHSYAHGAGASTFSTSWGGRLAALIGSTKVVDYGVNGSFVSVPSYQPPGAVLGAQSWLWAYRNIRLPGSRLATPRSVQPAVFTGLNDFAYPAMQPTLDSLAAFVQRVGENSATEDSSRTVRYGKRWTKLRFKIGNSGSSFVGTRFRRPGPITITTPRRFPGGTVVLHGLALWPGGRWVGTVRRDGKTVASFRASADTAKRSSPVVIPVRNVRRGRHKIQIRTKGIRGGALFDYWGTVTAKSPYVIVFKQPLLPAAGDARHPSTAGRIQAFNAGVDRLARKFDNIIAVDLSMMNGNASFFVSDQIHPNDLGHAYIAAQANAALRARAPRVAP